MVDSMAIEAGLAVSFVAAFMEVEVVFIQGLEFVNFDLELELFGHLQIMVDQLQDFFDLDLVFVQAVFLDPVLALYLDSVRS